MPQQITPDGFRALAKRASLNFTEDTHASKTIGSSLDHLIGTWTQAEADEMIAVLNEFDIFTESRGQD